MLYEIDGGAANGVIDFGVVLIVIGCAYILYGVAARNNRAAIIFMRGITMGLLHTFSVGLLVALLILFSYSLLIALQFFAFIGTSLFLYGCLFGMIGRFELVPRPKSQRWLNPPAYFASWVVPRAEGWLRSDPYRTVEVVGIALIGWGVTATVIYRAAPLLHITIR